MEPFSNRIGDICVEPMNLIKENEEEEVKKDSVSITDSHSMTQEE